MKLSYKVRYGVACLIELAKHVGEFVDANFIAVRQNIPPAYAHKILQALAHAGLVFSQKGSGYRLMRPLAHITVLEVMEALTTHEDADAAPLVANLLEQKVNMALKGLTLDGLMAGR